MNKPLRWIVAWRYENGDGNAHTHIDEDAANAHVALLCGCRGIETVEITPLYAVPTDERYQKFAESVCRWLNDPKLSLKEIRSIINHHPLAIRPESEG